MCVFLLVFFVKQKTAYEMRISDWSSDVCSSDLVAGFPDLLSAILLTTSLALLFDLAFFGIFSQRFSILTMCFCFYHIFFYIVPGIVHISENRFPFYGLSYPIEEVRSASVLILVFTADRKSTRLNSSH